MLVRWELIRNHDCLFAPVIRKAAICVGRGLLQTKIAPSPLRESAGSYLFGSGSGPSVWPGCHACRAIYFCDVCHRRASSIRKWWCAGSLAFRRSAGRCSGSRRCKCLFRLHFFPGHASAEHRTTRVGARICALLCPSSFIADRPSPIFVGSAAPAGFISSGSIDPQKRGTHEHCLLRQGDRHPWHV